MNRAIQQDCQPAESQVLLQRRWWGFNFEGPGTHVATTGYLEVGTRPPDTQVA